MNYEIVLSKYKDLIDSIEGHYYQIKVIDNYDWYKSNPYTIFYLNKRADFNEFKKLWDENRKQAYEEDLCYEDILDDFWKKAKDRFDYVELGTLNIYTDREYELEI